MTTEIFENPGYFHLVEHNKEGYKWNGQHLYVPGNYGVPTKSRCIANYGRFRLFSYRRWEGNGMGYSSTRFLVDTETKNIYYVSDSYSVESIKRYIERYGNSQG